MRGWLWIALSCMSSACTFDSGGGDGSGQTQGTTGNAEDDGESDAATADDATGMTAAGTDTSGATDPSTTSADDPSTTSEGESDTGQPPVIGCPDELPDAWIFCNDFDDDDAADAFSEWDPQMDRMAIVEDEGRDGSGALEFTHVSEPDAFTGRAVVRFGDTVADGTVYEDDESFDELFVRVFVRTEAAWPDGGPGDLMGIAIELTDPPPQPDEAVDVSVYTPSGQQVIGVHPSICFTGDDPVCAGFMGLGAIYGDTPVWSAQRADAWQCIELHVQLDDRRSPGTIELTVDGVVEAVRDDYVFVEDWSEHGWNHVRFTGSWDGGGPAAPQHRWIDDVVISSEPIGCG